MNNRVPFLLAAFLALAAAAPAADDAPPATLMTKPGRLLASEDFAQPLPPPQGNLERFSSGFQGWRFNRGSLGGHWEIADGAFCGSENVASHHPATASYGIAFTDAIIQCELQMSPAPLAGRAKHTISLRCTDTTDYVCGLMLDPNGVHLRKEDHDHGGPDKTQVLASQAMPLALGEWQQVVIEIMGDEMVGTVNGHSLTGRHPLIASAKKSLMVLVGGEGSVRRLRIWTAEANPDWPKNRQALAALP